ncbi:HlyD family efflux transporter periplasmic adaptor subunit [Flavihumibacter sp. R14]|nr:HlyD family efflux transporter periplasmic adaptor subunit [Flavihumibacter soli]
MKNWIVGLIIILLLISCNKDVPGTQVRVSSLTESVYASGIIKAGAQYNVFATVNGILKKVYVSEGEKIKKGKSLFLIEDQTSRLNTENARLALQLSAQNIKENSNRLRELELPVHLTKDRMQNDSMLYSRQIKLWENNVGSKVELEQRKLAYESSRSAYLSSLSRYRQAKTQLTTEYRQAQNNLKINEELQSNYTIKSETDGLVYDILREQGELVTPQAPIAVIGREADFIIELQVDEYDIVKTKPGQKVLITMDSYKGQVFDARIERIYPIMNERSRTFTVDAVFIKPPQHLYPNLTLEANIVIQVKKNVKIIPREYLVDDTYVYTDPEKKNRSQVKVGLMDYQYAEILSGLDTGQYVYKP